MLKLFNGGHMKRELNPELFTERAVNTSPSPVDPHFLNTDRQIFELRKDSDNLNSEIDILSLHLAENIKQNQASFEKVNSAIQRLEQNHNGMAIEIGNKFHLMQSKLNERKAIDSKIQEMMDRHNNAINGFEIRIAQLQKIIAEKDAQLLGTQTLLNEAKIEITRLKRL